MKNITEMSKEELMAIQKEIEVRRERDAKAKERARVYREANAEKTKQWSERARVRNLLLARKAKEMGITVSDAEIDEYLK